jgi:2-polyprenyl-6-hydroxyphenyl methylase/3-demethylubiquinone-9 3-methyltransferase
MEKTIEINNSIYDALGERWYLADDDPVALLRAESKVKCQWVESQIERIRAFEELGTQMLDVGCGAGFISNHFGAKGYSVTGVDLSKESLEIASRYDKSKSVRYIHADAYNLPFADEAFDSVTCMDFLEHVEEPQRAVTEMSRVLKPGGYLFFHTFNRNPLSYILVIKSLEWFLKNTPPNMHLYRMFIRPSELSEYCKIANLEPLAWTGIKPLFANRAFWKSLFSGSVDKDFGFETCSSTLLSYMGAARKGN